MTARSEFRKRQKAPLTRINLPREFEPQTWHDGAFFLWSLFAAYCIAVGIFSIAWLMGAL